MRIITCASYYGTGSSAITDLLSEYDGFKSLGDYEFRFVQDPGGISDLEYNIVENNHRHNSGHALKRYKNNVDFLAGNKFVKKYEKFFNNHWKEYSYEYIDELTDFKYKGYWHQDVIDRGKFFYIYKRIVNKILKRTIWKNNKEKSLNELPNEITLYSSVSETEFLRATKEYIDRLFKEVNLDNKENIMVDQIVPPSNLKRYLRYFNDIRVFVVDRDPRDIYLLEKYIWKGKVIPTESVELFCKWFLNTRKHRDIENMENENIMFVQFEDLIYKYDNTIENIEMWLGIDKSSHINKKNKLDPNKSKKNTKLWEYISGCEDDVRYIEKELSKYIYSYNEV